MPKIGDLVLFRCTFGYMIMGRVATYKTKDTPRGKKKLLYIKAHHGFEYFGTILDFKEMRIVRPDQVPEVVNSIIEELVKARHGEKGKTNKR